MLTLTPEGQTLAQDLAQKYGVSQDAVLTALQALVRGHGRAAQFDHPDLGGRGQWLSGGMTMVGDMFNSALKAKVDGLFSDLSAALAQHTALESAAGASAQSQSAASGGRLFLPDTARQMGHWWPVGLGAPSASGSQNDVSYALFPGARRLAIEFKGHVTVYDTQDHQISGLSAQQPGDASSLTLTSQKGVLRVADLPVVSSDGSPLPRPAAESPPPVPEASAPNDGAAALASHEDVIVLIERLAQLKDKGILTDEEFTAKKSELLRRL